MIRPEGMRTVRLAVQVYRAAGKPPDGTDPLADAVWLSMAGPIPARSLSRVRKVCEVLAMPVAERRQQLLTAWRERQAYQYVASKQRVWSSIPVEFVDGNAPPRVLGTSGTWCTKGGTPIRYPSAYRKRGWSNAQYSGSTRRIEVGRGWGP